jgi:cyclophilin family peptidyl-prolyl cis-trans isomerase
VIQAGDPTGTGWGGPGYEIVSEFSDLNFGIGYVGMASAGKDTESSQFFIMQGSHPHLNGRYTIFAKVIEGMEVVNKITEDDKIISINLE